MQHILCPTCFHHFQVDDAQLPLIIPCPTCGLSLNCANAVVPEPAVESPKQNNRIEMQGTSPIIVAGLAAIPVAILILIATYLHGIPRSPALPNPASDRPNHSSKYQPPREDAIDAFVDREVNQHWRPIPGGNSKEDAKILTRDILKARNWEELESVLKKNSREGR